ncbi:class I SAM-dependent methyltransferase [Primorskyibacter sp. 2E107]|uniref:class I SAM-dependent methyltransferase n=1 Tax=Primorskyibacter sp. 2E107 TaxID=3403458 RepID=UPI003AF4E38E
MTALADILKRQIATTGPLTLADYMTSCLLHPVHGYYTTRDPLGAQGDFTTAPEISQMFGELIGLCLAQTWLDQGAPAPFILAELGPGRGTLMADALRAAHTVPGFHAAAQLHLVEASPTLRREQASRLSDHTPTWHDSIETVPDDAPLFLIANEFFDALPIRQFTRDGDGWRECVVGLSQGTLAPGLTDPAPQDALAHRIPDTTDGDIVETCSPALAITAAIAARIGGHGGAALLIDYGDWRSLGDTLQALEHHATADPFANPGQADLTAHVDFEALAGAAAAFKTHSKLTPQGVFLERLGITQRAQALAQRLSGSALQSHVAAHRRLTHPAEMGSLFKILALFPKGAPPPPGLNS